MSLIRRQLMGAEVEGDGMPKEIDIRERLAHRKVELQSELEAVTQACAAIDQHPEILTIIEQLNKIRRY